MAKIFQTNNNHANKISRAMNPSLGAKYNRINFQCLV